MFKKLRNRLLIMNLSIISILMLIAFSTIYFMLYNNIHSTITRDLYRSSDIKRMFDSPPPNGTVDTTNQNYNRDQDLTNAQEDANNADALSFLLDNSPKEGFPDKSISFNIYTDLSNNILVIQSFFDAEDSFYANALASVLDSDDDIGRFTLDGNTWAYMISNRSNELQYTFVDMTAQQKVLDRLVFTFLFVSGLSLMAIFIISNFLTSRSIRPIKEAFEKQKSFISDASHELKTPLAVIRTNVDVLISNKSNSEDTKWLNYIKSEVERMGKLTNDLLYLTQMEGIESTHLLKNSVQLNDKIENIMLGMDAIAFEKNINLTYKLDPDVQVKGNSEQLVQIIMILLDNALKYTPSFGNIHLSLTKSHRHATIAVTNSGEGIPHDSIPYIFDRFYRVDKSRSRSEGSFGLGLSIAKAIVEQHGGKISCESELHKTTTFSIKLPLSQEE